MGDIEIKQETDYPWDGKIKLTITKLKGKKNFSFKMRVPDWAKKAVATTADGRMKVETDSKSSYMELTGEWKKGDVINIDIPMETRLIEANPLVEESRGQIAVQRGPIVYCIESNDLNGTDIDNIAIPLDAKFTPVETKIDGSRIMALETEAINRAEKPWTGTLYREVKTDKEKVKIRLIPYYAWGNRGKSEMTVWIPAGL